MVLKKYIPWVIIGILCVIIIILQQCRRPEVPETVTIITHDTIPGDSIPYYIYVPKPYPVYIDSTDTVWMDKPVDTAFILRDYHKIKYYSQTVKDDTSALITVNSRVKKNSLDTMTVLFQNRRPTIINTTITNIGEIPRNKFFVGVSVGRSLNNFAVGPSILWVTKKQFAYGLMYDLLNKDIYGTFYYKLSFRKK